MNINYRVALDFSRLPDPQLDEFTMNIITCLTDNVSFPTPPVTLADLTAAKTAFENALAAAAGGGKQLTALKNAVRESLVLILRREASYVQGIASQDLAMLLSSGFDVMSTNRARGQLDIPAIVTITNEMSTQLVVSLQPVVNAKAYQVRYSLAPDAWQDGGIPTQARRVILMNLTPGMTYTVEARAVGGSTGYSDWSDPVSHMAM